MVLLAPQLLTFGDVIEFDSNRKVVTVLRDPSGKNGPDSKRPTDFLCIHRLPFVMVGDAMGNDLYARQPRQTVVDAFCDPVRYVFGVGVVASSLERQNGD